MDIYTANEAYLEAILENDVRWLVISADRSHELYSPDEVLHQSFLDGELTGKEYLKCYVQQLKASFFNHREAWRALFSLGEGELPRPLVLLCDSPRDASLRRMLVDVATILSKHGELPKINYLGEYQLM